MTKKAKKSILLTVLLAIGVILFTTLQIIKLNPRIAEWWSVNVAQYLVGAMARVSDLLPFSLFEFFIIFAVIIGIFTLIVGIGLLVKRKFHTALNGVIVVAIAVFAIANAYAMTAEFQYHRAPLQLHTAEKEIELQSAIDAYEYFAKDFNNLALILPRDSNGVVKPYTDEELDNALRKEFSLINNDRIYNYTPKAKPILNSWFMTDAKIAGITFMPTGEANYNKDMASSAIPQTIAHELAHTKGIMYESDANLLSYYVLLNSGDNYLRYCGYFQSWHDINGLLITSASAANKELAELNLTPLNEFILKEMELADKFWEKSSFVGSISKAFNNLYLKLNGATNGTGSYFDNSQIDIDVEDNGNEIIFVNYSNTAKMLYETYLKSAGLFTI